MEIKIKKCFRCKNEIKKDNHYYAMVEMKGNQKVRVDYVHKVCWDSFLNQLKGATSSLQKSNYLLDAMGKQMNKMGMLPEEEVLIQ